MKCSNDEYFDPKAQLLTLSEEQAIEYAKQFFDQNCECRDAAYLSEIITAGEKSTELTYSYAIEGSPVAQLAYGYARLNGLHVQQSISEGLFWLLRSYNNGNAKAALLLASVYLEGKYIAASSEKALLYASYAAEQGLAEGQYFLANLLIGISGIPEDHERAVILLRMAAKAGYEPALQMQESL